MLSSKIENALWH